MQVAHFRAGLAGGAAPDGAVPSGGLFVTGTVTVPVTVAVSVTVIFVIVCFGLLSLVITPITLLSFGNGYNNVNKSQAYRRKPIMQGKFTNDY